MADEDSWEADNFQADAPIKKVVLDKWEGEDEEDNVKDNWDDDDDEEEKVEVKKGEVSMTEKKKLTEKIKEKENLQRKNRDEFKVESSQLEENEVLTLEQQLAEKVRVKKLQEQSDLELAKEAFGITNHVSGIDAMSPSTKEDFTEFEKLLKDKILLCEKSVHYCSFLESLFRDLCLSLDVEDLKKIHSSLAVLLSERQKQEKQNKTKKKKKSVLPGGGLKAKLKDDLVDYGDFDGGYVQDYEDFM